MLLKSGPTSRDAVLVRIEVVHPMFVGGRDHSILSSRPISLGHPSRHARNVTLAACCFMMREPEGRVTGGRET